MLLPDFRIDSYGTRFSGSLGLGIILGTLGLGMVVGRWYGKFLEYMSTLFSLYSRQYSSYIVFQQ